MKIDLPDEAATAALAEDVAACLRPGDVIALSGGLGVGKTTFARALIRAVVDDSTLDVPSPTFTLVQSYDHGRLPIAHFDLYRLAAPDELEETGLDEALADGAVLIEWPERAGTRLPAERLDIGFEIFGEGRRATVTAGATWTERLKRSRAIRGVLERAGWGSAARRHLQGDASTRTYERIGPLGHTAVLMNWLRAEVPAVKDARAAHRARDVRPFVAVDRALSEMGLSAPEIYAEDLAAGLLLMEDLGSAGIVRDGAPMAERYEVAIDVLATIHAQPRPSVLPIGDGTVHRLPVYGAEALTVEIDFFSDWYVPHLTGRPLAAAAANEFKAIWLDLTARLDAVEKGWVLLDFHSPNLLWLPERSGLQRLGILDFQDLLVGPSAYDVASLAQDARATVPAEMEADLRRRYVELRRAVDPRFDAAAFDSAYAILAAQRATKLFGVFARLADAGGKPRYLRHIPRLGEYLARSLAHPVLSGYAHWYERNVPPA
jgi:tRNA threonylcarbamoyl adenosine modification protein YjeE